MAQPNYIRTNTVLSYQQARQAILNKSLAATGYASNWKISDEAYRIMSDNAKLPDLERTPLDCKLVYGPKGSTFDVRPGMYFPTDGRQPVSLGGFSVVVQFGQVTTPLTVDFAALACLVQGKPVMARFADKKAGEEARPTYKGTTRTVVNLYTDESAPTGEAWEKHVNDVFNIIDANFAGTTTKATTTKVGEPEPS